MLGMTYDLKKSLRTNWERHLQNMMWYGERWTRVMAVYADGVFPVFS